MLKKTIAGILVSTCILLTVSNVILGRGLDKTTKQLTTATAGNKLLADKIAQQSIQIKTQLDKMDKDNTNTIKLTKQLQDANSLLKKANASIILAKHKTGILKRTKINKQSMVSSSKLSNNGYNDKYSLFYKIVEAEAGANGLRGREAVANVIINRVASKNYPRTINAVISQRYQFEPYYNGTVWNMHPTKLTIEAVNNVLAGTRILPTNVLAFLDVNFNRNNSLWNTFNIYGIYGDNVMLTFKAGEH